MFIETDKGQNIKKKTRMAEKTKKSRESRREASENQNHEIARAALKNKQALRSLTRIRKVPLSTAFDNANPIKIVGKKVEHNRGQKNH